MRTLLWCHRIDDGFNTFERIIIDVDVLNSLAHTRNHRSQVFQITHLLDLGNLTHEIVEIKLVLLYFFLQTLCFFFIVLLLCFLYQRNDVTHAKDTVCHTLGMELVDSFQLLTSTYKLNRLVHHRTDRQSCTTTSVTIQFGQYNARKVQTVIELFCRINSILTGH